MICWSIISNIITGLISGVISGLVAAKLYDRLEWKNKFHNAQQLYAKYIMQVRAALAVCFSEQNTSAIRIILEQQPNIKDIYKRSFKNRNNKDIDNVLHESRNCLDEIQGKVRNNSLLHESEWNYQRQLALSLLSFLKINY